MSNHLSPDQFARCFVRQAASVELQHVKECAICSAELEDFGKTISSFRSTLREEIDARVASQASAVFPLPARPTAAGMRVWQWALVVSAAIVLIVVPFFTSKEEPPQVVEKTATGMDPDALMRAVNVNLSRRVAAPLEPMMTLLPSDESKTDSGGIQ